ncbi:galactitol-1-phosphate 5-dehydrogenase [Paenibacillus sacheonensis]|uniref:Alcohol dehydrogenase catalytic domain-containing protein n=1 Tax=Paenibacillus sacheonensis TaxID=742054 RepID=A0A7X5BXL4_9BACL|nr:galactitol-1-phosphate 5-dehydrogenase [Paenibacillus sacheonensis]MBM7565954.1 L-iditol 2-dehydrogenase [Paenibacillus sacheonensis]NBC68732.1 alcohol dehydrogenase catalytic domain-containing protein [Paenibacillus sacheonensis]
MKANVLFGLGDLRLADIEKPAPGPGEVLLHIGACGVCGSDIPRVFTKGTYRFPTVPGHEFAGRIVGLGPDTDPALLNRKAAVFPLLPCRNCPYCEIGEFALCDHYDYMGSRRDGAFAEYIVSPVWNLVLAPDSLGFEELAMTEPAAVAVHALRQAGLDVGDRVFISGAGPIGLMLAYWAKAWGASRVMLADVDATKLAFANELGFTDTFNPLDGSAAEWAKSLTGGLGADVAIEGAGIAASWENCLRAVRKLGRVVLMGNPAGGMALSQDGYWEMLRKQLTVRGTWNSSYGSSPRNEWRLVVDSMASGKLNLKPLISHRCTLDDTFEALRMMRERTQFFNKVMILPSGGEV